MAYRIRKGESLTDSLQRITREQIDKALETVEWSDTDHSVHEVRKRCKKLRGLFRLVRPGFSQYQEANRRVRDAARLLAEGRERTVAVETHRNLISQFDAGADEKAFEPIGNRLAHRKADYDRRGEIEQRLYSAVEALQELREDVCCYLVKKHDHVLARGLEKTYRRARDAMELAANQPADENLHELRKRVKYHRYHARLLENLWPEMFVSLHNEAERLSEPLGDDHDLAALRRLVLADPEQFGGLDLVRFYVMLIDGRRYQLQTRAFDIANEICTDKPKQVAKRADALLGTWR